MEVSKVMIIGLDCAEPTLVFDRWRDELPTLGSLIDAGAYGELTSVIPPITVPAWSCMMSSRTPGDLGVYGFRNRSDHSYDGLFIANGSAIREPRLWDLLSRKGKRSIVVGVPGTYPPRPLNGALVSCFLTPSTEYQYTYPPMLRREVEEVVGEYLFDCPNFRTEDKDDLLRQLYDMTDRRFALCEHLLSTKPWELFVMVEMGTDRIHHGSHQRVAAPRGLPRNPALTERRPDFAHRARDRLVEDCGVGRRRLLLANLPERARPRTGGNRGSRRLRARARRTR